MIREQAIEMIVREGFDGLSMQKLAKKAGISASTIYVYFNSREDLLYKLYLYVQNKFEKDVLDKFSAELDFEQGLWLQWKNRLKNIIQNPLEYQFYEQFRSSPLINHQDIQPRVFKRKMNEFVDHAVANNEIDALPPEIFWALAYGPFYTLVRFHLDKATMAGKPFTLTDQKLKEAFTLVLKALKK